jgi:hypothetical protein
MSDRKVFQHPAAARRIEMRWLLFPFLGVCLFLASGCAGFPVGGGKYVQGTGGLDAGYTVRRQLTVALMKLAATVDPNEARILADTAVRHSLRLAETYRIVRPAVLHNMLVNAGIRDRGLCIHWTHDLMKELLALDLQTIQFRWGIACPEGIWGLEHNSVVACAVGADFEDGIVLDPWRDSGRLFWSCVPADNYAWQELPLDTGEPIEKRYPCRSNDGKWAVEQLR